MSTSRFLLSGAFPFSTHNKPLSFISRCFFPSPASLQFRRCNYSAAVDAITGSDSDAPVNHPWPEWVTFVDRLKTKGYFQGDNNATVRNTGSVHLYTDINFVKDASLSFARDRYDVFKSLPIEDIQKVVEHGCPNLYRKAVNSGKRLRAYVRLDEGDVCSACNLRGSCDRAYGILKESEVAARTVDIVRILLFYALDPLVITQGELPPDRESIYSSARKLFSEFIKLSDTSLDPSLPKPASKSPSQKEQAFNLVDDELSPDVEMKRGDWMCPKCNFLNFSRNMRCLKCKEYGPKRVGVLGVELKKGDWTCSECNFMNFSKNRQCLKCKAEGPKRVSVDQVEMKKGDWNCTQCGFMNFSSNKNCLRCSDARPKRQLNPGEWECPSCDFLNYRRNKVCLKCNGERPTEAAREYEEQMWRSPRKSV